jgi:hypothetical protein
MMKIPSIKTLKRLVNLRGATASIALVLALMGAVVYLAFSIHFANTQRSTIDEGLFLYKGYLFATNTYHPFQDYGPHTEYGPLSYLIPGYIQLWFGPGLRTGRIFAVIIGVLALLGLWAAARRLAGPWWAVAAVWAVALNPAIIRFYSFGLSQGLVACLLMWTLFFALGKDRPTWQTSLSAVLAGLILLTRQNMAPVLPVLLVYIFWQYGRKQGLISTLAGTIIIVVGHIIFWPGILMMWAPWLPASLTPFLNKWRLPEGITPSLNFQPDWLARLYSLLEGFRFHFVSLVGSIVGLALWSARKAWKTEQQYRSGVFLAVLFFLLLGLHAWAGLGFSGINFGNASTFNPYLAFFNYIGLLFTISVFSNIQKHLATARQIVLGALVILISIGIGYGGFGRASDFLLSLRIPRIRSFLTTGKILPGYVPLWDYLASKFGITYHTAHWMIDSLAGLLSGLLILLISFAIWSYLKRRRLFQFFSYGVITASVFMLTGLLFSPTVPLGGGFTQWQCDQNVIATYQNAGQYLARVIPPGSQIYWEGGDSVAVLLYVPGIKIYPQQLDWQWNYWLDGDPDALSRLGHWNIDLAEQWRRDADVIIIQQEYYNSSWQALLSSDGYSEALKTNENLNCIPDSSLLVYHKR